MAAVIDSLRQDHINMAKLLAILDRQIAIFDAGGRPDYDIIDGVVEYCHGYSDLWHHPKEDLVLEKLRSRDSVAAESLDDLIAEHENLEALTGRFADAVKQVLHEEELPRDHVVKLARDFVTFSRRHMQREETAFLPLAARLLTSKDWADIAMAMANPEDPLFGPRVAKHFAALRTDVLALDRGEGI